MHSASLYKAVSSGSIDSLESASKRKHAMRGLKRCAFSCSIAALFAFSFPSIAVAQTAPMADTNGVVDNTPDSLNLARTMRPEAGSTRHGDNPVLFLVGNSTMRTGTKGNGDNGQWGWGYFAPDFFDSEKISVENHAMGGMSSRTFYNVLWQDVLKGVQPGDWVVVELGHNDNGPYDSGRARASIPGVGTDSLNVTIQETGVKETVFSYGEYMRKYIRDIRSRGGRPILLSPTPRNLWEDADSTILSRPTDTYCLWTQTVAQEMGVPYIDLNSITSDKYEGFGKEKVKTMHYLDRIHTSEFGAKENAASFVEGVRANPQLVELAATLIEEPQDTITEASRREGRPIVFTIGDSTVKNAERDSTDMWGWGSVLWEVFDPEKVSVENHAMAGRSARTFMDEGRWDKVYRALQPGDYVLMQFGHNDLGEINTGKARGEIHGSGDQSQVFFMPKAGRNQVVYTYGWYLRKIIYDCLEKGAIPVVISPTPRFIFDNGIIESNNRSTGLWAKEVAEATNTYFIDLNALTGEVIQKIADNEGLREAGKYFKTDHTHTSLKGARLNAQSVARGLINSGCPLAASLKKEFQQVQR